MLNAIVEEIRPQICPSKINTIFQPDDYVLALHLWNQRQEQRLLVSVDARYHYLFLAAKNGEKRVSTFGKFLQHHIKGAEIRQIHKPPLERIVTLDVVKKDLGGQIIALQVIIEIMGRYSNVILIQQDTKKILDSIRHVTAAQSSYRRIAPGAVYVPPPPQTGKQDIRELDQDTFYALLDDYEKQKLTQPKLKRWKFLLQRIHGLSPQLAREVAGHEPHFDYESRWQRLSSLAETVKTSSYHPTIVEARTSSPQAQRGQDARDPILAPLALSAVPLRTRFQDNDVTIRNFDSMCEAAQRFYAAIVEQQQYNTLQASLHSDVSARLTKLSKKCEHLRTQRENIEQAEEYKQQGELLTANLYRLQKGMTTADVIDYYDEQQRMIEIPLDPKLTPAQNAQRYFKRYNKLKHGKDITETRLQETEQDIRYLEELLFFIDNAETSGDLRALQEEIQGTDSSKKKRKKRSKAAVQEVQKPFLRFTSSDGFEIYVGRSSRENDLLTQRTALPDDIWLHAQHAPGSHAVILNRERHTDIPERTLEEAASLAAYHSKLRRSGFVDVMYTPKKYVKKPKGAHPGLVTVAQFQTIRVTPHKTLQSAAGGG